MFEYLAFCVLRFPPPGSKLIVLGEVTPTCGKEKAMALICSLRSYTINCWWRNTPAYSPADSGLIPSSCTVFSINFAINRFYGVGEFIILLVVSIITKSPSKLSLHCSDGRTPIEPKEHTVSSPHKNSAQTSLGPILLAHPMIGPWPSCTNSQFPHSRSGSKIKFITPGEREGIKCPGECWVLQIDRYNILYRNKAADLRLFSS